MGVAEIQKMSRLATVGDVADMQLLCYQTSESPSSGKCSIFCYRLTYISKMCSMHHNNLKLSGQIVSNPPEKSHRCEAYVCCCPIFGHRQCIRCPGAVIGSVLDVRAWSQVCELIWDPCSHYSMGQIQFQFQMCLHHRRGILSARKQKIFCSSRPGCQYSWPANSK